MMRWWIAGAILLAVGAAAAFSSWFRFSSYLHEKSAWRIVGAPNHRRALEPDQIPETVDRHMRVEVGPPGAELDVWLIEPAGPVEGTTVVLHGVYDRKRTMVGFGCMLASSAGQRSVLVDLRGHGMSSGDFLSFGQVESRDLAQVLDHLAREGLLKPPVSVYGPSYGASVAIQAAANDPRISKVVAVAGFASFESIVVPYIDHFHPQFAWMFSDRWAHSVVDRANALADIDLRNNDNVRAIQTTEARVLLIHGENDRIIGVEHARALFEACGAPRCRLVILPDHNHRESMSGDRLNRETLSWIGGSGGDGLTQADD
ncbi:MAG: alpha/beta fold hydrolase [Myxococcota bacterium]